MAELTRKQVSELGAATDGGILNLAGRDLSGLDLTGISLRGADLTGADLSGANLSGVNLSFNRQTEGTGKLTRASLGGANLSGANLEDAILYRADLTDVKGYEG